MDTNCFATITGVVLAGGQSRRMGQDKAKLNWQGRSLLEAQLQLLESVLPTPALVSGSYSEFNCIADQQPSLGPLSGLASCLEALPEQSCLFIPVDMPMIHQQLLHHLLEQYRAAPGNYFCENSVFPIILQSTQANRVSLQTVLNYPQAKQRSIKTFLHAIQATELSLPSQWASALVNTNTPQQWQQVQQLIEEKS